MKNSLHMIFKTLGWSALVIVLHGCGGGGGSSSKATSPASGPVQGVATPSNVSVVTAQNVGS